ncbi:MAG: peptidase [Gammaproteobacteria bacterium]|nr:peptidase [Gammaproteobacteria bacterium]
MRPPLTISAILFALAASGTTWADRSAALVFGRDDRQVVKSDPGSLFGPVGIVYGAAESRYATAFLVGDCYALTVQHAFGSVRSAVGRPIMFAAGVTGPAERWQTSRAKVVVEGGLEQLPHGTDAYAARTADWAILRLTKCLGRKFGVVKLNAELPRAQETIGMAGYPIDRPLSGGLLVDPSCHIRDSRSGVLLHDCATLPGNSGGPLFRIVSVGGRQTLEVFAVSEAGHSYNMSGADLVLPVTEYYSNYANVALPICRIARIVPCLDMASCAHGRSTVARDRRAMAVASQLGHCTPGNNLVGSDAGTVEPLLDRM